MAPMHEEQKLKYSLSVAQSEVTRAAKIMARCDPDTRTYRSAESRLKSARAELERVKARQCQ